MSSEDLEEIPPPQKSYLFQSSTSSGFQDKVDPSSQKQSTTRSQIPDTQPSAQPSTQLFTELHLADVEKMFEESIDSNGALDLKTFIKAMKKLLSNVSDDKLEALFLKMDSDCNGFVTWPKYVDYMMREFQGMEKIRRSQYRLEFELPMKIIPLNHGCEIMKVEFLLQRFKKIGYFVTVTKDGILQFWSESFSLINSFMLHQSRHPHDQQMWVTSVVCMYNMNLLAVSSTELKIDFFDISNHKCVRAFTFSDLDSCVLVMDYWSDYHRGVFCYGDTKGNIIIFVSENVTSGMFNPRILPRASKWDHWTSVSTQKLLNEKSALYRSYRLRALHSNWCQQVKFIPQLNLVVSCAATEKSSLVLTILPTRDPEKPKSSVLSLRKGILCFDYCPDRNFLVTGGYDPRIRLWNPLVSKKPIWLMKGHQTSVTHILVNSKNSNILISISSDKNVRVWDMQDYVCLQSLSGKLFALGNCPITSAYFHNNDNTLVCSTFSIGILSGYMEAQQLVKSGKNTTHSTPLCSVLYSKSFKQVVSGCLQGSVCVWEILTGRKMMEFSVSGGMLVELTTMALDESERCLLTGLRDGTMKMWNYGNGECLLTFPNPDRMEISGIVHMNKAYYMAGWNKRITNFMFHKTKPVLLCYHWQTYHTEDILSMAKYQNQFLGTSSYNGDILFWNVNMLRPILSFNASQSPLPLQPKKVEKDDCLPSTPCKEPEKWANKASVKHPGPGSRFGARASLRRNLSSAPPVMRGSYSSYSRGSELEKPLGVNKPKPGRASIHNESERKKGELQKKQLLQRPSASVEKIIFLQTRPRLPHTAAMLSSCIDGYIYAWSIHGSGGLLGKFPVDLEGTCDVVAGAMATDENDWILITGDCRGQITIWDIKNYCAFIGQGPPQASGVRILTEEENKFRFLIPKQLQLSVPQYIPPKEKEVVAGHPITLVPPKYLITWQGHLGSVADIIYVDNFQLIISAGQDRDVKAWKLSGDAIGTFGLSIWKKLQDAKMDGGLEQKGSFEDKADLTGVLLKGSRQELQKDLAEALMYQRREQVALMALLHGKADKEAEAWAKLHKMAQTSPWAGEHPLEDIEDCWNMWESKGKQVSQVVGAAFKPRGRSRNPKLLCTDVQYGWMKHQISPQVYQSLYFNELTPIQQPDFLVHKALDQHGRHIRWVASDLPKAWEPAKEHMLMDGAISMPFAASPLSSLSPAISASRLLDSNLSVSLRPPSSGILLRPWSASTVQSVSSVPPRQAVSILHRSETPMSTASSLERRPRPPEASLTFSMRWGSHVKS